MTRKSTYFYFAAALAILIPVPGRFAFGVIMLLLFNFLILCGVLFHHALLYLNLKEMRNILLAIEQVALVIFFKQLLILYCPVIALNLGFLMYLSAFSSGIILYVYRETPPRLALDLQCNLGKSAIFSAFAAAFFLIRDIVGYGTITFPLWRKIGCLALPTTEGLAATGSLVATIPGAFMLLGLVFLAFLLTHRKFTAIREWERSQQGKGSSQLQEENARGEEDKAATPDNQSQKGGEK